jgi:hypothetical protein
MKKAVEAAEEQEAGKGDISLEINKPLTNKNKTFLYLLHNGSKWLSIVVKYYRN